MRQDLDTPPAAPAAAGLAVEGPWDPAQAARFAFGPREAGPDGTLRLAFVRDDLAGHAGVVVRPRPSGSAAGATPGAALELCGEVPDPAAVARQVARILSLDRDARPWAALAAADPVLAAAHARHPGLRPVLFSSPWEAAAWAVLSQRRQSAQARALHRRLADALGAALDLDGVRVRALPTPEAILRAAGPARGAGARGAAAAARDRPLLRRPHPRARDRRHGRPASRRAPGARRGRPGGRRSRACRGRGGVPRRGRGVAAVADLGVRPAPGRRGAGGIEDPLKRADTGSGHVVA